jgi:hypothetical protein
MTVAFPTAIAAYLEADRSVDSGAFDQVFLPDAVVIDEDRTIEGLDAIKTWKAESREKYRYTVEPLELTQEGDKATLSATVSGDFPGSPVVLTYAFVLDGDKVKSLEIV